MAHEVKNQNGDLRRVSPSSMASVQCGGRKYSCDGNHLLGLILIVSAATLLVFAAVCSAGVFGGGKMGFIAGGLTISSMALFGIAAYLLLSKPADTLPTTEPTWHGRPKTDSYTTRDIR